MRDLGKFYLPQVHNLYACVCVYVYAQVHTHIHNGKKINQQQTKSSWHVFQKIC